MSARNGDKARFGKQRKRKMAHRARTRDLRESLVPGAPAAADSAPQAPAEKKSEENTAPAASSEPHAAGSHAHEHAGALGSAAEAIGSVLGTVASKVRGVKQPEAAHAD